MKSIPATAVIGIVAGTGGYSLWKSIHSELEIFVSQANLCAVGQSCFHIAGNHAAVDIGVIGRIGIYYEVFAVTLHHICMASADGGVIANEVIHIAAFLADAEYRHGREAKSEHNEFWAPDEADEKTMGNTFIFYVRKASHPVKFTAPSYAYDITKMEFFQWIDIKKNFRRIGPHGFDWTFEYGGQRTPTSQWTVTGAGCMLLGQRDHGPYLNAATIGNVVDYGVKDANNMGAAMAPAAASTIKHFLEDTNTAPEDYDLIYREVCRFAGEECFLAPQIVHYVESSPEIKRFHYKTITWDLRYFSNPDRRVPAP